MEELGRFKVVGELGGGPQATTYEARDEGRSVALKVLSDEALPADAEQRAAVAGALAGLKGLEHPSIVKVLDAGELEGKLFVATELMTCPTLAQKLQEQERLEEQQVVLFVRQMAQALDKARDLGYCHGELAARNLFVVSPEKVKLTDFSVKALIETPPAAGEAAGQAATEAAGDEWVTAEDLLRARTSAVVVDRREEDLVSLAVLMMTMLGVEVPEREQGQSVDDYREALLKTAYPQVSEMGEGLSVHTAEVIRRLITTGGFDNPGEVVVELASAMLLGRSFGRTRVPKAPKPPAAAETAQVSSRAAAPPQGGVGDLSALEFKGDPRTAAFTPFFIWTDRRGGRFFVVHDGERVSIGRDPDMSDWTLMDPAISRRHSFIVKDGPVLRIEDGGSSNGTFVNGERVEEADLQLGDVVRVGTTRLYLGLADRE